MRLSKAIVAAGIAARRKADEIIEEGRVTVDGKVETNPATPVDLAQNSIKVDGKRISQKPSKLIYIALHKPLQVMSTTSDPEGRPCVVDFVPKRKGALLYPVGRLDFNSSGLIILTNDGDLAQTVSHPKHHLSRTYMVKVSGKPNERALNRLRKGVKIDGKKTQPAIVLEVRYRQGPRKTATNSWLKITIYEGRNRQIRKMCDVIGHSALKIKRTSIGNLKLGKISPGEWRYLTPEEVEGLKS